MTEALIDALADTVAVVKAKTLYDSLTDIKAQTLLEALNHTLAKDESRNTRRNVEAEASADMQADKIRQVKAV